MEMNMKANHITDPEHLRMNNYMRMTIGQFSTGDETGDRQGDECFHGFKRYSGYG